LPRLDAVKEIAFVVAALVQPDGPVAKRFFDDRGRRAAELAAVDEDPPVAADERGALRNILLLLADNELHAVGVGVGDAASLGDVVPMLGMIGAGAFDLDGAAVV